MGGGANLKIITGGANEYYGSNSGAGHNPNGVVYYILT